jgi:hypothetical protein
MRFHTNARRVVIRDQPALPPLRVISTAQLTHASGGAIARTTEGTGSTCSYMRRHEAMQAGKLPDAMGSSVRPTNKSPPFLGCLMVGFCYIVILLCAVRGLVWLRAQAGKALR